MSQVVYISVEPSTHVGGNNHPQSHWIHPHLSESSTPIKGREFRATALIPKSACLLVDRPYAIIPVVDDPSSNCNLICSNPVCNKRAFNHSERHECPRSCTPDVAWCSVSCRTTDENRHSFECTWLKRYAASIRKKWSEYDFGMLWLVVRILATRQMEDQPSLPNRDMVSLKNDLGCQSSWHRIDSLCASTETWPHDRVRFWTNLVKKYLQNSDILPHGMFKDALLHLICQEEANSFGVYPRETGSFPLLEGQPDRGEQFAAAVYPVAAIMNHSCFPNVSKEGLLIFDGKGLTNRVPTRFLTSLIMRVG